MLDTFLMLRPLSDVLPEKRRLKFALVRLTDEQNATQLFLQGI